MSSTGRFKGHLRVRQLKSSKARVYYAYWRDETGAKHGARLGPAHVRDTGRRTSRGAIVWRAGDGPRPTSEHLTPQDPRGIEVELALIHFGLSMYLAREMAAATARRWPRLGRHLAEIELVHGNGSCWAHTGQPGHITVWGRPLQLLACVADILPVEN